MATLAVKIAGNCLRVRSESNREAVDSLASCVVKRQLIPTFSWVVGPLQALICRRSVSRSGMAGSNFSDSADNKSRGSGTQPMRDSDARRQAQQNHLWLCITPPENESESLRKDAKSQGFAVEKVGRAFEAISSQPTDGQHLTRRESRCGERHDRYADQSSRQRCHPCSRREELDPSGGH